jgi:phosphoglycerol transferase
VKIEYTHPLPEQFDLVITAKAYGPNANKPVPVRVGNQEQTLTLGNDVTTTRCILRTHRAAIPW